MTNLKCFVVDVNFVVVMEEPNHQKEKCKGASEGIHNCGGGYGGGGGGSGGGSGGSGGGYGGGGSGGGSSGGGGGI